MNINWYPGHMAKTRRIMGEKARLVDVVVELLDARVPRSSKNPEMDSIFINKNRIVLLNKSDLADDAVTTRWVRWYQEQGIVSIPICAMENAWIKQFKNEVSRTLRDKVERDQARGMTGRSLKMMVVGIPNVGKSAFINKLCGRVVAETGDRPGVTRTDKWAKIDGGYELLDTPGVLWPKFEDEEVAKNLACTGAIKDQILDVVDLAEILCGKIKALYPESLMLRYKAENLEDIGRKRGFLISGGEIDLFRAANIVLDEFRAGKIGRISLEVPECNTSKQRIEKEKSEQF